MRECLNQLEIPDLSTSSSSLGSQGSDVVFHCCWLQMAFADNICWLQMPDEAESPRTESPATLALTSNLHHHTHRPQMRVKSDLYHPPMLYARCDPGQTLRERVEIRVRDQWADIRE
jgi:hypothetical protein